MPNLDAPSPIKFSADLSKLKVGEYKILKSGEVRTTCMIEFKAGDDDLFDALLSDGSSALTKFTFDCEILDSFLGMEHEEVIQRLKEGTVHGFANIVVSPHYETRKKPEPEEEQPKKEKKPKIVVDERALEHVDELREKFKTGERRRLTKRDLAIIAEAKMTPEEVTA